MKKKVNIRMVDDQPGKLLGYEAILVELDHNNLILAASGNEALEHLLKNDIAVVLIDVNMPGMEPGCVASGNGIDPIPRVHYALSWPRRNITVITASGT